MFTNNKNEIVYINDMKFDLPPEAISISKHADINVSPIIGGSSKVLQFGVMKKEVQLSIKLPVKNEDGTVNSKVFKLFNMLINMPFAYITNDFIISSLNVKPNKYGLFGIDIIVCSIENSIMTFNIKFTYIPIETYFLTNKLKFYDKNGNIVTSPHKAYFGDFYCDNNYKYKKFLEDILKIKVPTSYRKLKILDLSKEKSEAESIIKRIYRNANDDDMSKLSDEEVSKTYSQIIRQQSAIGDRFSPTFIDTLAKEKLKDDIKSETAKGDILDYANKQDGGLLINTNNAIEYQITVEKVIDGDTVIARFPDGHTEKVRLLGVNTREMGSYQNGEYVKNPQPYAEKAKEFTNNFVQGKQLVLFVSKNDKYKRDVSPAERLLGVIYDPSTRKVLNYDLVKEGLAEILPFENDIIDYDKFVLAQEAANLNNIGIWEDELPTYGKERYAVKYYFEDFEIDTEALSKEEIWTSNITIQVKHQNIYQTLRGVEDGLMQNMGEASIEVSLNLAYSKENPDDYESTTYMQRIIDALDTYFRIHKETSPLTARIPLIEINNSIFDILKLNTYTFIDYMISTTQSPGSRIAKLNFLYTKPTTKDPFLKYEPRVKDNTDLSEVEKQIRDVFLEPIRQEIAKLPISDPSKIKKEPIKVKTTVKKNVHIFKNGELVSTTASSLEEVRKDLELQKESQEFARKLRMATPEERRKLIKERIETNKKKIKKSSTPKTKNTGYYEELVLENNMPKLKTYYNGEEVQLQVDKYGKTYFMYHREKIYLDDAKYNRNTMTKTKTNNELKQNNEYRENPDAKEYESIRNKLNDLLDEFDKYANMSLDELLENVDDLSPAQRQKIFDILDSNNVDTALINKANLRSDIFKCGNPRNKSINYYLNIEHVEISANKMLDKWIDKTNTFLNNKLESFAAKWKSIYESIINKLETEPTVGKDKLKQNCQSFSKYIAFGENDIARPLDTKTKVIQTSYYPKDAAVKPFNNETLQTVEPAKLRRSYTTNKRMIIQNNEYYYIFNILQSILLFQKRMYPGYKLYIIEDNSRKDMGNIQPVTGRSTWADLDTYFSAYKVMGIALHKNKDRPDDVLTIYMYNPTIWTKATKNRIDKKTGETIKEDIEKEFQLLAGTKIQLWMGYGQDPNDYELMFNGIITESSPTDDTSLLASGGVRTLICQSYGRELLNPLDEQIGSGLIDSTQTVADLIRSILTNPMCPNFGYYDPYSYSSRYGNVSSEFYTAITRFAKRLPGGYEDNVFWCERDKDQLHPGWWIPTDDTLDVFEYAGQTMWEILKDISYKFPHKVMQVVPYGERVTFYFGPRFGYYFWRPPESLLEKYIVTNLNKGVHENSDNPLYDYSEGWFFDRDELFSQKYLEKYKTILQKMGVIKPFASVHYALTGFNIIANNIIANNDGVFTRVIVRYDGDVDEETMVAKTSKTLEVKLHEDIPDNYLRTATLPAINCRSEDYARLYAAKFFQESLSQMYKGNLILVGNPYIKPNDIIIINDDELKMYGPVVVREVTHIMDGTLGFITVVTPGMLVEINSSYDIDHFAVLSLNVQYSSFLTAPFEIGNHMRNIRNTWKWASANYMAWSEYLDAHVFYGIDNLDLNETAALYPVTAMLNHVGMPVAIMPLVFNGVPYIVGIGDLNLYKYLNPFSKDIQDKSVQEFMEKLVESKIKSGEYKQKTMDDYVVGPPGGK